VAMRPLAVGAFGLALLAAGCGAAGAEATKNQCRLRCGTRTGSTCRLADLPQRALWFEVGYPPEYMIVESNDQPQPRRCSRSGSRTGCWRLTCAAA